VVFEGPVTSRLGPKTRSENASLCLAVEQGATSA